MDQILEAMAHGDSPIELRMQSPHEPGHSQMLAEIKKAAFERLEGDRLKFVLRFIDQCGGASH